VLYGDFNNWFAAFAFWVFKYYGFKDVRIMNGGRKKWLEEDREVTKDIPNYSKGNFKASEPDKSIRIFLNEVKQALDAKDRIKMVDVRSPKEFTDELKKLYESKGITQDKEIIAYCRIGERSSHTWFVLKYLLGYPDVKNYDGSWTEWGNMIANPIEK
jgi:thiosulfate/3-mercaptopyruvate sulfurtransferase